MRTADAKHYRKNMLDQCLADVEDGGTTLSQYSTYFGIRQTGVLSENVSCLVTLWKLVDNISLCLTLSGFIVSMPGYNKQHPWL